MVGQNEYLLLSGDPSRSEVIIIIRGFYTMYVKKNAKFQRCHPPFSLVNTLMSVLKMGNSHVDRFGVPLFFTLGVQLRRSDDHDLLVLMVGTWT